MIDIERERERQRHRRREKQASCQEPDMGLDPRTPGSCPGPKAGAKPLSHPGIPWAWTLHRQPQPEPHALNVRSKHSVDLAAPACFPRLPAAIGRRRSRFEFSGCLCLQHPLQTSSCGLFSSLDRFLSNLLLWDLVDEGTELKLPAGVPSSLHPGGNQTEHNGKNENFGIRCTCV